MIASGTSNNTGEVYKMNMHIRSGRKVGGTFLADPNKLSDPGIISHFLRELIKCLEMTSLGYHIYDVPIAVKRLGQDPLTDEGGVTGLAVLSTSHAAIHTWPEEAGATFDIHSCRDFNPEVVENLIRNFFAAHKIDMYDLTFSLKEIKI